jgi:hypothetical protein
MRAGFENAVACRCNSSSPRLRFCDFRPSIPRCVCTKQHPTGSNRAWQTPQKTHHANRHLEPSEPDKQARNGRTHTTDLGTATQAGVRVRRHRVPLVWWHIARHCTRKSTFHLQIQINKTRAVHSPGIDALGFNFTCVRQWPAQLPANR